MSDVDIFSEMKSAAVSTNERRGAIRHLANRVCYAQANGTNSGMTWGVTLWDISTTGISVVLKCELEPGIIIGIQPFKGKELKPLVARVVRTVPREDGWMYGCELLQPLSEEEMAEWLS